MVIVMVAIATVVGPVPLTEAGLQVVSAGKPAHVKVIAEKPVDARTPIVVDPVPPGLKIVTEAGLVATKNPGAIVKVTD